MPKLYTYIMTDDTGAAPNPHGGALTLAICKPTIRRVAQKGDIIVGIVGGELSKDTGMEELSICYVAKVTDKFSLAEYDKKCKIDLLLAEKTPVFSTTGDNFRIEDLQNSKNITGDNFYDSDAGTLRHYVHSILGEEKSINEDLDEPNILFCEDFRYLGIKAVTEQTIKHNDDALGTQVSTILDSVRDSSKRRGHRVFPGTGDPMFDASKFYDDFCKFMQKLHAEKGEVHGKIFESSENLEDRIRKAKKTPITSEKLKEFSMLLQQNNETEGFPEKTSKKTKRSRSAPIQYNDELNESILHRAASSSDINSGIMEEAKVEDGEQPGDIGKQKRGRRPEK